tara:strand:+ start:12641 stop:12919 length:279 start_codon:yes stop_codon:yes gene_type:complete
MKPNKNLNSLILLLMIFSFFQKAIGHQKTKEGLIERICLNNFSSEMNKAGKEAPKGMSKFTCDCFLLKLNEGYSITESIENCKDSASEKYNL